MSEHEPLEGHPDPAALEASRRAVEDLLASGGMRLHDPALWEAPPDLEDRLLAATTGSPVAAPTSRLERRWVAAVASMAAAVVLVVGAIGLAGRSRPDWTIPLTATELAPGAAGTASGWNEASGTRVRLDVEALPQAPRGFFYELWFSSEDVHISGGTFQDPSDVELWVAVARREFPRVWITLEPIDSDEAPSGQTVLDSA